MSLFAELDRLKDELDSLRPLQSEQEQRILQKFRLEWNYNSNAIEGNSLTLGETRSLLLHGITASGKPIRDHLDIRGHNEAVLWLEEFVRDERPLTEQFIRSMHQVLLGEPYYISAQTSDGTNTRKLIRPGQYKITPNNTLTSTGEIFYFSSPEDTPSLMTELIEWYSKENEKRLMHPVALAAEFHYRFVHIHPFDDGNGRMSRLLMNLILMRNGYPMVVIKADDRNRYLAALSEADAGDLEPFFRFIIENTESSLLLMIRAAKGEPIDEPDDLDKKLALLKKQVWNREDFARAIWNPVTQSTIFKSTIIFWLHDLDSELKRFNDLFDQSGSKFYATDKHRQGYLNLFTDSQINEDSTGPFEFANIIFTQENRLVEEATFEFYWNKFRLPSIPFDLGAKVNWIFDQYKYKAQFAIYERTKNGYSYNYKTLLESTYIQSSDTKIIHDLNHHIANNVYDFIATKVTSIDNSPF
jgi:Fic family protein